METEADVEKKLEDQKNKLFEYIQQCFDVRERGCRLLSAVRETGSGKNSNGCELVCTIETENKKKQFAFEVGSVESLRLLRERIHDRFAQLEQKYAASQEFVFLSRLGFVKFQAIGNLMASFRVVYPPTKPATYEIIVTVEFADRGRVETRDFSIAIGEKISELEKARDSFLEEILEVVEERSPRWEVKSNGQGFGSVKTIDLSLPEDSQVAEQKRHVFSGATKRKNQCNFEHPASANEDVEAIKKELEQTRNSLLAAQEEARIAKEQLEILREDLIFARRQNTLLQEESAAKLRLCAAQNSAGGNSPPFIPTLSCALELGKFFAARN